MPKTTDPERRLAELEAVFAALAHPARRQILMTVHFWGGSMTAGDIARRFGHAWPTTTRHLRVLEEAGLLAHEKVGRTRVYRVDRSRLDLVTDWLSWFHRPGAKTPEAFREPRNPDDVRREREQPSRGKRKAPGRSRA